MPVITLKQATEKLGISLDDPVFYSIQGQKGIIEVDLNASDHEIELSAVHDSSEDFLTEEELNYYLNLEDK